MMYFRLNLICTKDTFHEEYYEEFCYEFNDDFYDEFCDNFNKLIMNLCRVLC